MAQAPGNDSSAFLFTILGGGIVFLIALGLAWPLGVSLLGQLPQTGEALSRSILYGVAATLPLLGFLAFFLKTTFEPLARFRESQVEFLSQLGFELTLPRIIIIGLVAGVSEETLFRGVLQQAALAYAPITVAIIAPNIIFGALHARTTLYALIAGVIGVYLGVIMAFTDDLLAPIVTHALYDVGALLVAKSAIESKRAAS